MSGTIAYASPFVPPEWIAAHGFTPLRRIPDGGGDADRPGVCPWSAAVVADAARAGARAAVFTTTCDQMRRGAEEVEGVPVFLMNVPHTLGREAWRTYLAELRRLSRFLVRMGGEAPGDADLAETMLRFEAERARESAPSGDLRGRVPLAVVGGPVWGPHREVFDLVREAGGAVVLDATETGERGRPAPFDRRALREDPLPALADAYFGAIPDAFRRPNRDLYLWLGRELPARGVRGILFVRCTWCDLWHAELARLREWCDLPVVDLDLDGESGGRLRTETRVQALVDMVR